MSNDREQRAREVRMFGCTAAEMDDYLRGRDVYDLARLAQAIISDAQEATLYGRHEDARQFQNRAKRVLEEIARATR